MVFAFETRGFTIGDLLSGSHTFRIPQFQRRFAWADDTAAQLFNDIQTAFERDESHYFLGPIIVAKEGPSKPFDIVDGQQRLLCLSVFLAVLRDLVSTTEFIEGLQHYLWRPENAAGNWSPVPRIKVRQQDQEFYEVIAGSLQGTSSKYTGRYNCALKDVVVRIRSEIKGVAPDYLKKLSQFMLSRCHVILINTNSIDDGYKLFRSINTLGSHSPTSILRVAM